MMLSRHAYARCQIEYIGLAALVYATISLVMSVEKVNATIVPFDSNSMIQANVEYYMQTNRAIYNLGENVEMLYRVTNLSNEEVTLGFPVSPVYNFWINHDGENMWRAVNGWWTVETEFTLSPTESKEFPYTWNMRDNRNNLVDIGIYDAIGGLYAGTGHYDDTRVSVSINIVPEPTTLALLGISLLGLVGRGRLR